MLRLRVDEALHDWVEWAQLAGPLGAEEVKWMHRRRAPGRPGQV